MGQVWSYLQDRYVDVDACAKSPGVQPASTGEDLRDEYTSTLERIADQAADRAAVVRTRIATLEAELCVLDGLATQLGGTT